MALEDFNHNGVLGTNYSSYPPLVKGYQRGTVTSPFHVIDDTSDSVYTYTGSYPTYTLTNANGVAPLIVTDSSMTSLYKVSTLSDLAIPFTYYHNTTNNTITMNNSNIANGGDMPVFFKKTSLKFIGNMAMVHKTANLPSEYIFTCTNSNIICSTSPDQTTFCTIGKQYFHFGLATNTVASIADYSTCTPTSARLSICIDGTSVSYSVTNSNTPSNFISVGAVRSFNHYGMYMVISDLYIEVHPTSVKIIDVTTNTLLKTITGISNLRQGYFGIESKGLTQGHIAIDNLLIARFS